MSSVCRAVAVGRDSDTISDLGFAESDLLFGCYSCLQLLFLLSTRRESFAFLRHELAETDSFILPIFVRCLDVCILCLQRTTVGDLRKSARISGRAAQLYPTLRFL